MVMTLKYDLDDGNKKDSSKRKITWKDAVYSTFRVDISKRYFEVLEHKRPRVEDFEDFKIGKQVLRNIIVFMDATIRASDARVVNMMIKEFDPIIFWLMVAEQKLLVREITRIIADGIKLTRYGKISKGYLYSKLEEKYDTPTREPISRTVKFLVEIGIVDSVGGLKLNKTLLNTTRYNNLRYAIRFLSFTEVDLLDHLVIGGV